MCVISFESIGIFPHTDHSQMSIQCLYYQIARKINNVEMSWALGAALHMLEDYA